MKKQKETPVVIRDSKDIQNILVQVNFEKRTTVIISNFSAWENLALLMEGLGITAEKCLQEGISKKKVYQAIENYMLKVLTDYKIIKKAKKECCL